MRCRHNPVRCIIPPHILLRMTESQNAEVRRLAIETLATSEAIRDVRASLPRARVSISSAIPGQKRREVYDLQNKSRFHLPGTLVRAEGDPRPENWGVDPAVKEAWDYSGLTYDFYYREFARNSLDDNGQPLISTVHLETRFNNAFWNGRQMAYGDGDGRVFNRFTIAKDVVAHELTHGIVDHESDLVYYGESGALNEHFADVFGSLVLQWDLKETVNQASWLIGESLIITTKTRHALRSMKQPGAAFKNDPDLGDDIQPSRMKDKYTGTRDNAGVHINSGIPNHAFYLAATTIGGNAWEKAGKIWYDTMRALSKNSQFLDAARTSHQIAGTQFGSGSPEQVAVENAWKTVGVV